MGIRHQQPPREWISLDGTFLFGKHKEESIEEVSLSDPSYLRWIFDSVEDISEEDREIISQHLVYRGRT